jgi:hypothetical protein
MRTSAEEERRGERGEFRREKDETHSDISVLCTQYGP